MVGDVVVALAGRLWHGLVSRYEFTQTMAQRPSESYLNLLLKPCIYRHAIKIDLGRTFPEVSVKDATGVLDRGYWCNASRILVQCFVSEASPLVPSSFSETTWDLFDSVSLFISLYPDMRSNADWIGVCMQQNRVRFFRILQGTATNHCSTA